MARLLSWVGDRSYAIYLVNGPVIALGLRFSPFSGMDRTHSTDLLLMSAVFLACTLVLAELTHRFVEVPARLHGRKLANAYNNATHAAACHQPAPGRAMSLEAERV
jgi:peptidoglycan/LPS O-acetylase OafA/YrhL